VSITESAWLSMAWAFRRPVMKMSRVISEFGIWSSLLEISVGNRAGCEMFQNETPPG
jgi:hypothetical protein